MPNKSRHYAILLGICSQLLFVLSWVTFGFLQGHEYSWIKHSISDMYAIGAPHGAILVSLLTICGATTILFIIFGLWPIVRKVGVGAKIGSLLLVLSIYGLGDLLSPFERLACRMVDVGCTAESQLSNAGGKADQLLSTVGIMLFVGGILTIGYSLKQVKSWRGTSLQLIFGGYLLITIFVIMGVFEAEYGGLIERIIATIGALLLFILATFCNRVYEK